MEPADPEKNRAILAERLGWPDGALEAVRQLEAEHDGYAVYWGIGRVAEPRPGFYGYRANGRHRPQLYAPTARELGLLLEEDAARRPLPWWERGN